MWMMNTGYVGGDGRSVKSGEGLKIKIPHSSAMLEALISGDIKWTQDPDFGYEVVDVEAEENRALLERVPAEILQPRRLFEATGTVEVYDAWVARMKQERAAFLQKYDVPNEIIEAVSGPK